MSHPNVGDGWESFKRRPPKEEIVAVVLIDILMRIWGLWV